MLLDLDELNSIFRRRFLWSARRPNFAWLRQHDHLRSLRGENDTRSLKSLVQSFLADKGIESNGPVRLLTQLRYLGFAMNPVSFFYCYEEDGVTLQTIVAQVNNTPWGEEHLYIVNRDNKQNPKSLSVKRLEKEFHVSPFMPMDMHYDMQFSIPDENLAVHMVNYRQQSKMLDVIMHLRRKKISTLNLMSVLISYPLISFKVFSAIYWQALILHLKRVPFFTHPNKLTHSKKRSNEPLDGRPLAKVID